MLEWNVTSMERIRLSRTYSLLPTLTLYRSSLKPCTLHTKYIEIKYKYEFWHFISLSHSHFIPSKSIHYTRTWLLIHIMSMISIHRTLKIEIFIIISSDSVFVNSAWRVNVFQWLLIVFILICLLFASIKFDLIRIYHRLSFCSR